MRNKELVLRRLRTIDGMMKRLDSLINRGGNIQEVNVLQREINESF